MTLKQLKEEERQALFMLTWDLILKIWDKDGSGDLNHEEFSKFMSDA
jgi:Ca2+-binding EF-hand superfamily protein